MKLVHHLVTLGVLAAAPGCHPAESGTDAEALGYGSPSSKARVSGYDSDPVPRAAPTPWDRPRRSTPVGGDLSTLEGAAAAPADVAHTEEVLRACAHLTGPGEAGDDEAHTRELASCHGRLRIARLFRNLADWKKLLACVEAGSEADTLARCDAATPMAVTMPSEYPRESATCLHVFALTIVEEMGAEPMFGSAEISEFEPLLHECVTNLVEEERGERNPEEYVEMLDCIDAATNTAVAEACE